MLVVTSKRTIGIPPLRFLPFIFHSFPPHPIKKEKKRKCCVLWWNFPPSNSGSSTSVGLLNTGGSDNDGRWTIGRTLLAFGLRYTRECTDPRQSEKAVLLDWLPLLSPVYPQGVLWARTLIRSALWRPLLLQSGEKGAKTGNTEGS